MSDRIRILVVEDHRLVSELLRAVFEAEPDLELVAVTSTVQQALERARATSPQVVIADQHLPDGHGTDLARQLLAILPKAAVVMLTGDESDETKLAALEAGAAAFLSKNVDKNTILSTVRRAAGGDILFDPAEMARLVRLARDRESARSDRQRIAGSFTEREREVLELMAQGLDSRDIAAKLGISVHTVRGHVQAVIEKCDAHSRLEAVLRASALGLVHTRPS